MSALSRHNFLPRRLAAAICLLLLSVVAAVAQQPSVTAVLSNSETAIARPVQLEIQVSGVANPTPPGEIIVDGLDIRSAGTSRQYSMQNLSVSYSFTFNYTIMPLRAGTYRIPPQSVGVGGGKTLQTPELTLNVVNSTGRQSQRQPADAGAVDPAKIGFVEMLLPKAVAYVGEMVPVQVRMGLLTRAPIESLGSGIQIAGQGFTTQKMPEPRQTIETINGRTYQVWIFKTAISAARPGKLQIGPAQINPVVRVPRGGQRNPSLPRDLLDDPFFNNFFNDPAFAPSMPKEIKLASESATLEVKPLPPNAPPSFAGAVGNFSIRADANPKSAQVGDPVTTTATIHGRGNFDRVTAPVLENESGWHKYPPSDKFERDDDVGISGAKTFETVYSAKERKDQLPPLVFSYFDPVKENYVTLRSDAIPLRIEGGAAPTATPAVAATGETAPPAATPSATPATTEAPNDILYQMTKRPASSQSFVPLYARSSFWLAQLVPLLGLAGFIAWRLRQSRLDNLEARRLTRLQHEAAELQRSLRANGSSPQEYLANASRVVQLKTALASKVEPNVVDAELAASTFRLDEVQRNRLRELFAQKDELRYSGGHNGGHAISAESRRDIDELIENLKR